MSRSAVAPAMLPVLNPATLEMVGEVPNSDPNTIDAAVNTARDAADVWAKATERRDALRACAKELKGNLVSLARLLTREQGKPLREAMEELMGAVHWLRSAAEMSPPSRQILSTPHGQAHLDRLPAGVVVAITPWNYPVILALWKIAPALVAGNCVLLKPSPYTPLTSVEIGELFSKHLPPGVLQVVTGGDQTGRNLVAHPGIDHLSLTGSIEAGRSVGAQAGQNLKSVTLELGGNDAALVLEDAHLPQTAEDIVKNAFKNCGQTCSAIKRVYVHRSLHDELTAAMSAMADSLVVGDGMQGGTDLGPVNNQPQLTRVQDLLSDALARGGSRVCGEQPADLPGYFHRPTIVTELSDDTPLVSEEQFGPVLPVLVFDDLDDALSRANRTRFGLGGSVWSANLEHASEIASRLQCGTTWVNQHGATDPNVPFGGIKDSGLGYANGQTGLEEFTRVRVSYPGQPASG